MEMDADMEGAPMGQDVSSSISKRTTPRSAVAGLPEPYWMKRPLTNIDVSGIWFLFKTALGARGVISHLPLRTSKRSLAPSSNQGNSSIQTILDLASLPFETILLKITPI